MPMREQMGKYLQLPFPAKGDISEFDMGILIEAFAMGNVGCVERVLGVDSREAARLLVKFRESQSGCRVREVFCTPDSRVLLRRVLKILGQYAMTSIGKSTLESAVPFSKMEDCESGFSSLSRFLTEFGGLEEERVTELLKILAETRIAKVEPERTILLAVGNEQEKSLFRKRYGSHVRVEVADSEAKVREFMAKEAHILATIDVPAGRGVTRISSASSAVEVCPQAVINYFVERGPVLRSFLRLVNLLGEATMFSDLKNEVEAIRASIRFLEGLQEVPVNLEDQLFGVEEEVNKEVKRLRNTGGGAEELREFIEDRLLYLENGLNLDGDESELLREAAYEVQGIPFAFSSSKIRLLRTRLERRRAEERYVKLRTLAQGLEENRSAAERAMRRVFEFDALLSIARFAEEYELSVPRFNRGSGIGFEGGRNLFLVQDQLKGSVQVEPVSYSLGDVGVKLFGAETQRLVLLTGANSGGKTTLLETLATVHVLGLLGLPVPAEKVEVPFVPLYLFRKRTARKVGSLEYAIRVLRPVVSRRIPKLVLMDEFEALTEPGALGRIIASLLNDLPRGSLTLFVTHLAREILPYLRAPVRVDGIEAQGIDERGNLVVARQPVFNHLGTSTPELILSKLSAKTKSRRLQKVYQNMIELLVARRPTPA